MIEQRQQAAQQSSAPPLRPTRGPFSLEMDTLFGDTLAAVVARDDVVEQLVALDGPPDLEAVINGQRDVLAAGVADQITRCLGIADRLHDLLVLQLSVDSGRVDELEVLVAGVVSLREAVRQFGRFVPQQDLDNFQQLLKRRPHPLIVHTATWLHHGGVLFPREGEPAGYLVTVAGQMCVDCVKLVIEFERRQVVLLDSVIPMARKQREFRALVTEWEVQQRDVVQSLESAMLSVASVALNTALSGELASRMRVKSFDGLGVSLTNDRTVATDVYQQVEVMIRDWQEGSFGIAGPRGVGKSTLIRFFASTPGMRGSQRDEEERARIGVIVSAPVAYDARDFVLHLYAEVCRKITGDEQDRKISLQDYAYTATGLPKLFLQIRGLGFLGPAALTAGIGLLMVAILGRLPWSWQPVADIGAALVGLTAVAGVIMLMRGYFGMTMRAVYRRQGSWYKSVSRPPPEGAAWKISVPLTAGLTLLFAGGGWSGGTWPFLVCIALLIFGFPATIWAPVTADRAAAFRKESLVRTPQQPTAEQISEDSLRELALDHLQQIRYQQSFSREQSMGLKVGGGFLVGEAGGKRGQTSQERPKTYPELVDDLRTFLAAVTEQYTMVIGVDELDKLRSHEDVENFLNDIKGIFGASRTFFLVSVSEDAAASFERRGAPFRDVFDSAFDDVISVRHLDMTSARKVLYGLLLGWSKPFIGLCYVLSGGLARDLRRSARELLTHRDNDNEIELGMATLAMCRKEAEARVQAIRHELMRAPFDPVNVELLNRVTELEPATATASIMRQWHLELVQRTAEDTPAARLGLELAAFLLFAATVIEFFDPAVAVDRVQEAEKPGTKCLATLAMARQTLAQSPGISLAYTRRFRIAWGLTDDTEAPTPLPG